MVIAATILFGLTKGSAIDHLSTPLRILQVAELGFSAIAALAKAWEAALSDKDKSKGKDSDKWMVGCATVANVFSELLQRAWLVPLQVSMKPLDEIQTLRSS